MNAPLLLDDRAPRAGSTRPAERSTGISHGILFALFVAVLVALTAVYLLDPRTLPIRHVSINGEFRHLSPVILQETAKDVVRGGFFNVNVETVRSVLMTEPWVEYVTVRRVWPDSLSINVKEQQAIALWNRTGLINDAGRVFVPAPDSFPHGLPKLSGPAGKESMMLDRFRYMQDVLSSHELKVKQFSVNRRGSWSFVLNDGIKVVLGRRDFGERFERFARLVPAYFGDRLDRMKAVDMRYTNGFAIHWKDVGKTGSNTGRKNDGEKS